MSILGRTGKLKEWYDEVQTEWEIPEFFSLSKDKNCSYNSQSFPFMHASWYLSIYPGGKGEIEEGNISLYLIRNEWGLPRTVEYSFGIKKVDGKVKPLRHSIYRFEKALTGSGYRKFFERSELLQRKSELMPSNVLTITCVLKCGTSHSIETSAHSMKLMELETLSENFKDLLAKKQSCDTALKVKDREFKAHASVLMARSPVFAAMFEHPTSEKQTGVVSITDCEPDSFGDFLQYLYSGKVENISPSRALHMYRTADKYDVKELKSFCVQYMMGNLTVENVFDVISLGEQYDETQLLSAAQVFFNENMKKIFSTAEWFTLMTENTCLANKLLTKMSSKVKIQN